jgi:hypothetical protein
MFKRKILLLVTCLYLILLFPTCKKYYANDSGDDEDVAGITGSEDENDYIWDNSDVIAIVLNGSSITASSDNVTVDGTKVTINSAGTYKITGTLTNGQLVVNTKDEQLVRLILSGTNITCSNSSPVYIKSGVKTMVVLDDNTENYLTDGTSYIVNSEGEPDAALFSKSYLSFYGTGSLTVNGKYNDGITGKDGLVIKSGTIKVVSVDDGIRGKDYLIIRDGNITINSGGDGLKSDNEEDTNLGYITIEYGKFTITASAGDAINARTNLSIDDGIFNIITGGGASVTTGSSQPGGGPGGGSSGYSGTISEKALKASVSLTVKKGTFSINSADDAIHSNKDVKITDGNFSIATGDDAVHADGSIIIEGGTLNITKCYEGMEGPSIIINDGNVSIVSVDDSFNATKGMATEANDGSCLYVNGGNICVNSSNGDGIDSNGNVVMTAGTVIAHGPASSPEVGIDVNGTFNVSGGVLVATGPNSGNMIEAISTTSSQYCIKATTTTTLNASSLFHISDAAGNNIITYKPVRSIYYIVISTPDLKDGAAYSIYTGGISTGLNNNGLYTSGIYSGGTLKKNFTISGKVTNVSF